MRLPGSNARIRTTLVVIGLAVVLGLDFPGFQLIVQTVPVLWFTSFRLLLALPVVLSLPLVARRDRPVCTWDLRVLAAALGLATLGLPIALTLAAITEVAAGEASILANTIPLWLGVFAAGAYLLRRQSSAPDRYVLAGVALGFGGVILITVAAPFGGSLWAIAFLLGNALLTAINAALLRRWFALNSLLEVLTWELLGSLAILLPMSFALDPSPSLAWWSWPIGPALLLVGLVGTGLLFGLWFLLLEDRPPESAGLYLYAGPVVSVVVAALFLGESFLWLQWLGAAVVFGTVVGLAGHRAGGWRKLLRTRESGPAP